MERFMWSLALFVALAAGIGDGYIRQQKENAHARVMQRVYATRAKDQQKAPLLPKDYYVSSYDSNYGGKWGLKPAVADYSKLTMQDICPKANSCSLDTMEHYLAKTAE